MCERGRARVVICGRCISLICKIDPVLGAVTTESAVEVDASVSPSCATGVSNHFTGLRCFSLTESKQIGHRTHLLSDMFKYCSIHAKQKTWISLQHTHWRYCKLLTCPHFVMRGAVGGERQIGQVVSPSPCVGKSPLAAACAIADDRGIITCMMSCHWK